MSDTKQEQNLDSISDLVQVRPKQQEKIAAIQTKQTYDTENMFENLEEQSAHHIKKIEQEASTPAIINDIQQPVVKEIDLQNQVHTLNNPKETQLQKQSVLGIESMRQQFLVHLIKKYGIEQDQQQQFCGSFNKERYQQCIGVVKKKLRVQIKNDIQQFIKKMQENKKKKQVSQTRNQISIQNIKISQVEFVKIIMQKFEIDDEDQVQLLKYLREQNIQQCAQYAKKKHREAMKKQIVAYLQPKNDKNSSNKVNQQQIQQQLNKLLVKFEIEEDQFPQCVKLIKSGETDRVLQFVKKKKRNQFKIQLERFTQHYKKYGSKNEQQQNQNNKLQQNGINLTIKIGDLIKEIKVKNGVQQLRDILQTKFGIQEVTQYSLQFNKSIIQNLNQIFIQEKKQGLLKLNKKIQIKFQFDSKTYSIWATQSANSQFIRQQISKYLNKNNLFNENPSVIYIEFCTERQKVKQQFNNLKKFLEEYRKIEKVIAQTQIQVTVYYQQINKKYKMKSLERIIDLKSVIEKDFMAKQCQFLEIQSQNQKKAIQQDQQNQLIKNFIFDNGNQLQLMLSNAYTSQFYGFNSNYSLTFQKFSQFIIENDQQILKIIKNINFSHKNQEKIFFDSFISYLFSCMKKRFPMQIVIDKIKNLVVKNKFQGIWAPIEAKKPRKMNQTFLLMYLLRNSDQRLKIQIMNIVKNLMSIPLQISNFQSIYSINSTIQQNQDIVWILKKGITICSIGLHNQQNHANQKGKSDLLNKLFFTNFCLSEYKHKIVERIPFIALRVYDDLFPLNIIDLPHNCSQKIKNKLIQLSDIVLIHSWKDQRETITFANSLDKKNQSMSIILMRDLKQSKSDLKTLSQANLQVNNLIKLKNLQNYEASKDYIDIVRQKVNLFLLSSKQKYINSRRILKFTQNQQFLKLSKIMSSFQKNQTNICIFSKQSYLLDKSIKTQLQNKLINQLKQKPINSQIQNFLKFISQSKIPQDIILVHFRQKLRNIQNQMVNKYMAIYKIKEKLLKSKQNQSEFQKLTCNADNQLKNLNLIYNKDRSILKKSHEQVFKIMDQITSDFENHVKPQIFSIQLFWREICAFVKFNPNLSINNNSLFDIIVDIKKKQIMNNQPFEIIDGDYLEMPKEIMKKVFSSIHDKCLVLTILGPQSSGKSTLLNFLFGCDFATSEGRCTRGVYGTYFRLNDQKRPKFQGIFVIDTEGLFALTNQSDQKCQDRQNFDSKLVLFCLAVSDLVIINVRGNFDKNTQKILSICNEKLQALGINQNQRPDIIIVLNQNNTSKTEESQNQFKKIRKSLNFDVSKSLSLAYSIKNNGKDQICLLEQNQIVSKKIPFSQFHTETTNLLYEITERMMKKSNTSQIIQKIDKFSQIWSTIISFPNLSQMTTKQYRQLQAQIKTWEKQQDEKNQEQFNQLIANYKSELIDQQKATTEVQNFSLKYIDQFKIIYSKQALNQQLKSLVQNETKQILMKNDLNFRNLKYTIMQINLQKQINREIFQGDSILRNLQKQIIKNQNNKIKVYSNQQKQKIFNQGFNEALSKIKKSIEISQKRSNQLDIIKSNYQFLVKKYKSQINQCGLPKLDKLITIHYMTINKYQGVQRKIVQNLLNQINQPSKFMKFTQKAYTNIFKNSMSDAKLKYFNMKDYFHQETKAKKYYISIESLIHSFNLQRFFHIAQRICIEVEETSIEKQIVFQIFQQINQYLQSSFELRIKNFNVFFSIYKQKNQFFLLRMMSQSQKLLLEIVKNKFGQNNTQKMRSFEKNTSNFIKINNSDIYQKSNSHQKKLMPFSFIEKNLKSKIQWSKIKKEVERCIQSNQQQRKIQNKIQQQNNRKIIDELNIDLAILNLKISSASNIKDILNRNYIGYLDLGIFNNKRVIQEIFSSIQLIHQQNILKQEGIFFIKLGQLKYFYGKNIQQNFKVNPKYICKDCLYIANFNFQVMVSNEEYFTGYVESDRSMKDKLKSKNFELFIFNEIIKEKKSLQLLLEEICKIVKDTFVKWGKFESNAISQVFCLINEELSQFNNDLNQVSHELNQVIVGQIHLIAIYLIWKLELDLIQLKQKELYNKKQQSRNSQLKRFMIRTSNDINNIISDQVQQFTQYLIGKFQQFIKSEKDNLQNKKKKQFQKHYGRQFVQRQVDLEIFNKNTSPQIILQYLEKPYEILLSKYSQNYMQSWDELRRQFSKNQYASDLMKQLEDILTEMQRNLQNIDKITQEKANPRDLFQMVSTKSVKTNDYDEEAKKILYQYLLDKMLGNGQDKIRDCLGIKVKPRQNLTKCQFAKGILNNIMKKMHNKKLKITNLVKFINICLHQVSLLFLKQNLVKICQFSIAEQKQYLNKIRVVICKQKCPCCARICGIEGTHSAHKCIYGHQMRALGGNYIESNGKKQAYVVRCEMLKQTDLMQYNGNTYTWTKFKDYWASKPTGGWLYDDIKRNPDLKQKQQFQQAWLIAGQLFCQKQGIEYVEYNSAEKQVKQIQQNIAKTHFIFALDESGSMKGKRWQDLIKALSQIVKKIKSHSIETFISIITFDSKARIVYQRQKPQNVNVYQMKMLGGGTDFEKAFEMAYQVANKYIHQQKISFIFMTDGGCVYPQNSIKLLQQLMTNYPKKFKYSGIEFNSNQNAMKLIETGLKGRNLKANNYEELLEAYTSCLEIIAYKEGEAKVMNMDN